MSKKKKKQQKPKMPPLQVGVQIYLLLMFTVFPIYCSDGFFNIRHDRYYLFLGLSLGGLLLMWAVNSLGSAGKPGSYAQRAASSVDKKLPPLNLSAIDVGMLGFLLCCILSTALSKHPVEALLGTAGRNNGLLLMAVYVTVYFAVSRCGVYKSFLVPVLALTTGFVSLVAVLNFAKLDPLNMVAPLTELDKLRFFSTIGNKNLLSAFLCITLPVLVTWFVRVKCNYTGWLYLASSCLGFAALMVADSDSGFLGMGIFVAVSAVWYARDPEKLKKFLLAMTVMVLGARLLNWLPGEHLDLGAYQAFFVQSALGLWLLLLLAAQTVLLYVINHKLPGRRFTATLQWILIGVLGCILAAAVSATIYLTFIDPNRPISSLWNLFRIDDKWGTNRGYMWWRSWEIFSESPLLQKLVGTGPDTFYYAFEPYFEGLAKLGDSSTNAAHNEYLNYLITLGGLGLGCYLFSLVGALSRGLYHAKEDPMKAAAAMAVLSCATQALVNIAQPITTPLFIIFLSICASRPQSQE